MLVRAPGFTFTAVLTLALGIGATAAIFSVVENVLLRPLPYRNADRIVLLTETNAVQKIPKTGAPYLDYRDWRDQSSAFEAMGTYWNVTGSEGLVLGGAGSAVRLRGSIVSRGLFSVLGVQPALGRGFRAEEDGTSGGAVFLISDGLWRRRFASNANVIGKAFRIDGQSAILIGVMPPGFQYPDKCEVWLPLSILGNDGRTDRQSHQFWSLGLLRPGVNIQRAQAQVSAIQRRLGAAYPTTDANWDVRVTPLIDEYVGKIRKSLLIILGAVLAIFLIACSNVSNLLLMRTVKRRREFSIRAALGAGRWDLFRQAVAENLIQGGFCRSGRDDPSVETANLVLTTAPMNTPPTAMAVVMNQSAALAQLAQLAAMNGPQQGTGPVIAPQSGSGVINQVNHGAMAAMAATGTECLFLAYAFATPGARAAMEARLARCGQRKICDFLIRNLR